MAYSRDEGLSTLNNPVALAAVNKAGDTHHTRRKYFRFLTGAADVKADGAGDLERIVFQADRIDEYFSGLYTIEELNGCADRLNRYWTILPGDVDLAPPRSDELATRLHCGGYFEKDPYWKAFLFFLFPCLLGVPFIAIGLVTSNSYRGWFAITFTGGIIVLFGIVAAIVVLSISNALANSESEKMIKLFVVIHELNESHSQRGLVFGWRNNTGEIVLGNDSSAANPRGSVIVFLNAKVVAALEKRKRGRRRKERTVACEECGEDLLSARALYCSMCGAKVALAAAATLAGGSNDDGSDGGSSSYESTEEAPPPKTSSKSAKGKKSAGKKAHTSKKVTEKKASSKTVSSKGKSGSAGKKAAAATAETESASSTSDSSDEVSEDSGESEESEGEEDSGSSSSSSSSSSS